VLDLDKEERWRSVFERFRETQLPFREFCERENINPNTFQYWRRELRKRDEARGVNSKIKKGDNRPSQMDEKRHSGFTSSKR
jgi:transposase-like protein